MRVYLDNCCYNRPFDVQARDSLSCEPFDYTEWRKDNLFVGETVDSLVEKARDMYADVYPEVGCMA